MFKLHRFQAGEVDSLGVLKRTKLNAEHEDEGLFRRWRALERNPRPREDACIVVELPWQVRSWLLEMAGPGKRAQVPRAHSENIQE